jgi:NADPH:quinone reductase-like Zn-dependent oxidoreductase/short-subunit dehydrogenase/acyl carrier protein
MSRLKDWSYLPQWQPATLNENPEHSSEKFLVFTNGPIGERVADSLERQGVDMVRVVSGDNFEKLSKQCFQIRQGHTEDLERLIMQDVANKCSKSLYLSFLDVVFDENDPVSTAASLDLLHTIQTLTSAIRKNPMRLFFVSQGAQMTTFDHSELNLTQAPLIGMVRVAANEYPDNQCTLIDLDADNVESSIDHLLNELHANDSELEICYRDSKRLIYRLVRADVNALERAYLEESPERIAAYEPYRIELKERDNVETLQLRRVNSHRPGAREVELRIDAISIPDNFTADLLKALPVHGEQADNSKIHMITVSATVLAVGRKVSKFTPGERMLAIVPALPATHVTVAEDSIYRKPGFFTYPDTRDSAQFLPILSAYYSLVELARMHSGDRVLIHNADSSDGLAAVCLAKYFGATVYATANRKDTIAFLRNLGVDLVLPAKSRKFARDIKAVAGEVDIVFNAADKEVAHESLKLLSVAGRFVGTMTSSDNGNLRPGNIDNKSISYYYVHLPLLLKARPSNLDSAIKAVSNLLADNDFPRLPVHVLSIQQLAELFATPETKTSLGERVLMLDTPAHLMPELNDRSRFEKDGSYLITGGFGGFGGEVARWMVARGARHLVLVGRRGIQTPDAEGLVAELESSGAVIEAVSADLSKMEDVARLFSDLRRKGIRLRGIMHAAGVLDDGVIPEITDEKYLRVVLPKSVAVWNIHQQTLDMNLEFMVLFSSITTLIGNPGQANYVAANTWLDSFAYYRRANGLSATSVNWGLIADVGFGVRNKEIVKHFDRLGVSGLPPMEALDCLEYIMRWDSVQYGLADMAWERLFGIHNPRFSLLRRSGNDSADASLQRELAELDNEGREIRITELFCEYVATTLELIPDQVNSDHRLNALGLDSLVAVELQVLIQNGFGVEMPMLELMKDQSIGQMSSSVLRKMGLSA